MNTQHPIRDDDFSEIADELTKTLTLKQQDAEEDVVLDYDDGDFEFSFAGRELHSPVSAAEVFQNGRIRPLFRFSDEIGNSDDKTTTSSVREVFVVSSSPTPGNGDVVEEWPEMRRKSCSTGLSKRQRVKDLLVRSHSEGKAAFAFLSRRSVDKAADETASSSCGPKKGDASKTAARGKKNSNKSAYEELYGKKEKRAGKSYLPYRQDLVGFFTNSNSNSNSNGITKNVYPC